MAIRKNSKSKKREKVDKGILYDSEKQRYYVTISYGRNADGKQIRETATFQTLKEARAYKKDMEARKRLGMQPPPVNRVKIIDYLEAYLAECDKAETTRYGYGKIVKYIRKHSIARKPLQEITPQHIRDYMRFLQRTTDMQPQSINKHLIFICGALERAWKDEFIPSNPAKRVDRLSLSEKNKFTGSPYKLEECKTIFAALENYRNRNVRIVFYLGIFLGLRRGEMLALKWENVDMENGYISIVENRVKVGGKVIMKSPKSKTSIRKIAFNSTIKELFKKEMEYQAVKFGGCEFVMVNPQTGKPLSPSSLQKPFKLFQNKFGIREVRIHDLRHTCGTLALQGGVDIKSISNLLGHSDSRITESIYVHPTDEKNQKAAAAITNLFY